jgi:hypothetical protein
MPNVRELESLIHYGIPNSSGWLNESGFSGIKPSNYWTSTPHPDMSKAFILSIATGIQNLAPMKKVNSVLPVRGVSTGNPYAVPQSGQTEVHAPGDDADMQSGVVWPESRFIDHGDGTITDRLTGLMWLRDGTCMGKQAWNTSLVATTGFNTAPGQFNCTGYSGTYSDWRMPNIRELESLINYGVADSSAWLNTNGFINIQSSFYWSSTSNINKKAQPFVQDFQKTKKILKKQSSKLYVLPVRGPK